MIAVLATGFLACVGANAPGHFSVDSISQLAQGRTGLFNDWHPPFMAWLLGIAARVSPNAAAFMIGDAVLFYGATAVLALARPSPPRWIAVLVAAAVVGSPQALVFQGVVWKDILFADTALAGFAALAASGAARGGSAMRVVSLAAAFLLFTTAALVRQMGLVAALAGALAYLAIEDRRPAAAHRLRRVATASGALALLLLILVAAGQAFRAYSDGQPGARGQLALLQTYDLAGAAHLRPDLTLTILRRADPTLWWFITAEAAPHFRPGTVDVLDDLPAADALLPPTTPAVGAQWLELIRRRPAVYLQVRAQMFWATLATPPSQSCPLVSVGVQTDDDEDLARAGLVRRLDRRDAWDEAYVEAFRDTPVLSHLTWGALAAVLLALALAEIARGAAEPARIAAAGLLLAAIAYVACFLPATLACDYRYLYFLDIAAMVALVERAAGRRAQAARPSTAVARRSSLPQPTR